MQNLVVTINCDRIWSSPSKYDFIVRISFLPLYSLVISQILIDVSVCHILGEVVDVTDIPVMIIIRHVEGWQTARGG